MEPGSRRELDELTQFGIYMNVEQIKKHPLNVQGRYYVDYETCLNHKCCVNEAPSNFKMDEQTWRAYVFKQPETTEEENQCEWAMALCPMEAIRDDGEIK